MPRHAPAVGASFFVVLDNQRCRLDGDAVSEEAGSRLGKILPTLPTLAGGYREKAGQGESRREQHESRARADEGS